jgi:hypothetical protein
MFDTLDQLIGPLSKHIIALLSQPTEDGGDEVTVADAKKGYIGLLNNVMVSRLHGILISEREENDLTLLDLSSHVDVQATKAVSKLCLALRSQLQKISRIPGAKKPHWCSWDVVFKRGASSSRRRQL